MNLTANAQIGWRWLGMLLAIVGCTLLIGQSASATTNYVFFSVNGDTSKTSMVQGDNVGWGANCGVGDTVTWEIWVDLNNNSVIDDPGDLMFVTFSVADGDTSQSGPPPDNNPVPDGWYRFSSAVIGLAPAHYIFKALDEGDATHAQRVLTVTALPSPPNHFRGHIIVAGHPAPDPMLKDLWVEADAQDDFQLWCALTNDSGYYSINVGAVATGHGYQIQPPPIDGYVQPGRINIVAGGDSTNLDFTYVAPADSLYGDVVDDDGALIAQMLYLYCSPMFSGPSNKNDERSDGHYAFYFGPSEEGQWQVGISNEGLPPTYLIPQGWQFRNDTLHNIHHDIVCYKTDTVLYVKILENGGLPTHAYNVQAVSESLASMTYVITGTGSGNIVPLHISTKGHSNWTVFAVNWDGSYPIPDGFIPAGPPQTNLGPGDTAVINFIAGTMLQDTIKVDPGDSFSNFGSIFMSLWSPQTGSIGANPLNDGVFTIYADTGLYSFNCNLTGYMTSPSIRTVHLTDDTIGGLGFVINQAHCRVSGALQNVNLPLGMPMSINAHTTSGTSYQASTVVDQNTGVFTFNLCDGSWTIDPPFVSGMIAPTAPVLTIGEIPDTVKTANLAYSIFSSVDSLGNGSSLPTVFALRQNYPNPFNPTTQIAYDLPQRSRVDLGVFNVLGQRVATLVNAEQGAGTYHATWDGTDAVSGIYFFRLTADNYVSTKKMVLLK
jgi:hypothetical protein